MSDTFCIIAFLQLLCFTGAFESGIVGGKESKPHSRRYMASLQSDHGHYCGGILIREDFVLTAAHCFEPKQKTSVVLGAHNISKTEASQQLIEVAEYICHRDFDDFDNDIMLLKLKKKAKLNKYVGVLGLPKKDPKVPALVNCLVVGWGRTGVNRPASDVLKETTETLQFQDECKAKWQNYFNGQHMICTKFDRNKGSICQVKMMKKNGVFISQDTFLALPSSLLGGFRRSTYLPTQASGYNSLCLSRGLY